MLSVYPQTAARGGLSHQPGPPLPAPRNVISLVQMPHVTSSPSFFSIHSFAICSDDLTRFDSDFSTSGLVRGGLCFRWVVPAVFASRPPPPSLLPWLRKEMREKMLFLPKPSLLLWMQTSGENKSPLNRGNKLSFKLHQN